MKKKVESLVACIPLNIGNNYTLRGTSKNTEGVKKGKAPRLEGIS
jgi:hypothetical protein